MDQSLVASSRISPLCDSIPVEIKCINVRRNTTVLSNCWRNQLHVSALFWVGHHKVETRISEKTHIPQGGHQKWGNEDLVPPFLMEEHGIELGPPHWKDAICHAERTGVLFLAKHVARSLNIRPLSVTQVVGLQGCPLLQRSPRCLAVRCLHGRRHTHTYLGHLSWKTSLTQVY
jgi:hypothetical protein